ncbi:MAG: cysteine synthase A, partial [Spirochaetaceae bacterium]
GTGPEIWEALGGKIDGFVPPKWDASLADHILSVQDEETLKTKDDLARIEGVFVGFTAAANVVASIKLYDMGFLRKGAKVVTILCDTGYKYLE